VSFANHPTTQNHNLAASINAAAQDVLVYEDGSTDIDLTEAAFTVLNKLRELPTVSYMDAIREAAGLLEPGEWRDNPEYLRGMAELLARLFGDSVLGTEGDTGAGSAQVETDIESIILRHV
jgi:hypothetical protein